MVRGQMKRVAHTMRCCNIRKKLSAYQDGELKSKEQARIRVHLQDCPECGREYAALERAWQSLGDLPDIQPGPAFYLELQQKIDEQGRRIFRSRFRGLFQLVPAPAAALALLLVGILAGAYLGNTLVGNGLWSSKHRQATYTQELTLASLRVFDPVPPNTLGEGYVLMASCMEEEHR
jgi:anti-sigma factor RsiW